MYNFKLKFGLLLCLVLVATTVYAGSNCNVGSACEQCPADRYKIVRLGTRDVKVCCPGCSKFCVAGNRASDGRAYCTCYYPEDIAGDCWKGDQCNTCLQGPNAGYVGSINSIPVCCANCERSGLMLGGSLCYCRHNGP